MNTVAKVELRYVKVFRDRHGKLRHYYRRKGFPSVALPGPAGSAEFMAAYAEAEARAPRQPDAAKAVQPRSINALIIEYYRSPGFMRLRDSTKRGYRNMLDRFREKHGTKGATSIQTHHLEAIFHKMADTPGAATNLRKRLRKVFRLAVRLGWRSDNPVVETEAIERPKSYGFTPWTEDEIRQFEDYWQSGTRERMALYLLLYTGQRRSDVVTMGKQHMRGARIAVTQLKTDKRLLIPVHPKLAAELEGHNNLTFLLTMHGKPFSAAGFTSWFVERAEKAGIHGRTPHGLRKAAGRRMAEAGCSIKEIQAILGHDTLSEAERYTRDASQPDLADSAMEKVIEVEKRTSGV